MVINLKKTAAAFIAVGFCSAASAGMYAAPPAPELTMPTEKNHWYLSGFGGWGKFSTNSITQSGVAFFSESQGGPLGVNATGDGSNSDVGMVGMNIGYQFADLFPTSSWHVAPALELEGYYMHGTQYGNNLVNDTDRLDAHEFDVTYPMNTGVFLVNGLLRLDHAESKIHPYVGAGLGTAFVSINGATSTQTDPAEEVNHYNTNPDSSDFTFAAQVKAGIAYDVTEQVGIFAEYRFLYLAPTDYTFGWTQDPTHVVTSDWDVSMGNMCYNMLVGGIRFDM